MMMIGIGMPISQANAPFMGSSFQVGSKNERKSGVMVPHSSGKVVSA
ncbi:MAG: hypothetical protein Q8K08_12485 [Pseudotabrizicola sp.]|nr:hypothetical protein [Pseudotabrizicola sp.]